MGYVLPQTDTRGGADILTIRFWIEQKILEKEDWYALAQMLSDHASPRGSSKSQIDPNAYLTKQNQPNPSAIMHGP